LINGAIDWHLQKSDSELIQLNCMKHLETIHQVSIFNNWFYITPIFST